MKPKRPVWRGPIKDGITFSLLSRFLICPERFRLQVVEGLQEDIGFNHAIEYGSLWHEAEEAFSAGGDWRKAIARYRDKLRQSYPAQEKEIVRWASIASAVFPLYIDYWRNHPDEKGRKPILEEYSFKIPYPLPSGKIVCLRGKFDCVFSSQKSVYLQENKTKGKIDCEGIQKTVGQNLQTMVYQVALRSGLKHDLLPFRLKKGESLQGTIYNVIKRPLGDRDSIRQKKSETEKEFIKRLANLIASHPEKYFFRWKIILTPSDLQRFEQKILIPLLERLVAWWDWIKVDPHDPWTIKGSRRAEQAHLHYQFPFGVYNSIASGFRGDYFNLLTTGSTTGLVRTQNLFPEL